MKPKKLKCLYKKSELSRQFIVDRMIEYRNNALKYHLDPCADTTKEIFKNDYVRQFGWNEKKIDKLMLDITDKDILQY